MRLRWRLYRLLSRAIDARIELLTRSTEWLDDKALTAKLEESLQETAPKLKDQHRNALYTSVGQALSHWASMEDLLVTIACLLLRTAEVKKIGIIMYSIINFNTWLGIIGELFLQEPLYSPLTTKWNKIMDRLRGLNKTRNRLAHHTIHYGDKVASSGDAFLKPGQFDTRQETQQYQPLDIDQIFKFTDSVAKVRDDLSTLLKAMTALLAQETSQQKSSEPNTDQRPA